MQRIKSFDELIDHAVAESKGQPKMRVAVCAAEDESSIAAMETARRLGLCEAVLVGDEAAILRIMREYGVDPANYKIADVQGDDAKARRAVRLVRDGEADVLMKGMVPTSAFLHPIFDRDEGLNTGNFISHVGVLQVKGFDRFILQTDGGINIAPTLEMKKGIVVNAVAVAHALGVERPKVALLSATEKVHPKIQSTVDAAELTRWAETEVPDADVEGPMALDMAISMEAAGKKGLVSPVAGKADILVASSIEVGNVIYKALRYFANAEGAGTVVGASCPIMLTSRSDPPREKVNSVALAVTLAGRMSGAGYKIKK